MDNQKMAKMAKIKWGWVALSFIFGIWPLGVALIFLKLMGEQAEEDLKRERVRKSQKNLWETTGTAQSDAFGRTQP